MRLYHVSHKGKFLGAETIVIAGNRASLDRRLKEAGIKKLDIYDIKEIPLKAGVHTLFDGNY